MLPDTVIIQWVYLGKANRANSCELSGLILWTEDSIDASNPGTNKCKNCRLIGIHRNIFAYIIVSSGRGKEELLHTVSYLINKIALPCGGRGKCEMPSYCSFVYSIALAKNHNGTIKPVGTESL